MRIFNILGFPVNGKKSSTAVSFNVPHSFWKFQNSIERVFEKEKSVILSHQQQNIATFIKKYSADRFPFWIKFQWYIKTLKNIFYFLATCLLLNK